MMKQIYLFLLTCCFLIPATLSPGAQAMMKVPTIQPDGDKEIALTKKQPGVSKIFRTDKDFKVAFKATSSFGDVSLSINEVTNGRIWSSASTNIIPKIVMLRDASFKKNTNYFISLTPSDKARPVDAVALIIPWDDPIPSEYTAEGIAEKVSL